MTAWIENHGPIVLGVGFLLLLQIAAACLIVGLAIYWIPCALNGAHLQIHEWRERQTKAMAERVARADKILKG